MTRVPTTQKPLSAMNDFVFKLIMGNPKHIRILTAFLQAILDIPPEEYDGISIVDPVLGKNYPDEKVGILDVKIHTKSGRVIDVEVQILYQDDLPRRMVFYTASLITEQMSKGEDYIQIKQVISIVITAHKVIMEDSAYHHCYSLYDKKNQLDYPERLMDIHILEIPKLPRRHDSTALWSWLRFFGAKTAGELKMVAKREPQIAEAVEILLDLSGDSIARRRAENREKARRDYAANLEGSRRRGREEGRVEGERLKALDTARIGLSKNIPLEDIADLSGLSIKEILALKKGVK